jgi:hypothetical protein
MEIDRVVGRLEPFHTIGRFGQGPRTERTATVYGDGVKR